ncbi:MAG: hypothetical protein EAX96_06645 [Candidatus Lokiarchaeota archaeon]|nr:hypothetical protein [Candidatus Lokiarchaeota archaeon]
MIEIYNIYVEQIKNALIERGGFRKTLLATGSAKLVKPLPNGGRVHLKEITSVSIFFDIDPDDPDNFLNLFNHAKSFFNWKKDGSPDNTRKVSVKKVMKHITNFDWVKEYEKEFELYYHHDEYWDYRRKSKISLIQRFKNFFKW